MYYLPYLLIAIVFVLSITTGPTICDRFKWNPRIFITIVAVVFVFLAVPALNWGASKQFGTPFTFWTFTP